MNFGQFLRDRLTYIFSQAVVLIFLMLFIYAFGSFSIEAALLFASLYLVGAAGPLLYEFRKKNKFYKNLLAAYDQLDRKNLVCELVDPPDFAEGMILYDLLVGTNKAYLDEISRYRRAQEEYRSYIELWIHEIKTPIASAVLTIENQGEETQEHLRSDLMNIEEYAMQALFYARSNSVEKDYIIQELSLRDVCFRVLRKNARLFIDSNVSVEAADIEGSVFCDSKWLSYILDQLISNAVKYRAQTAPHIIFRTESKTNETILYLIDNGAGILPEELPRIFDKGFTGTLGRIHERATGMGLFLSRKLCRKLGLSLEISSEGVNCGTTAAIHFPKDSMTKDVI